MVKNPRFYQTFANTDITGAIPESLFGTMTGAPAPGMFDQTFANCSKLSGMEDDLFRDLAGDPQSNMFYRTFYGDRKLYGQSTRINGRALYEIWSDATSAQVGGCLAVVTNYPTIVLSRVCGDNG